jgi:hypothetical protein
MENLKVKREITLKKIEKYFPKIFYVKKEFWEWEEKST